MIISRTPFRLSFFGGGTDYPQWYRQHGGAVLSTTIDKYTYLSCRHLPPFFEHRYRVVYSQIENVRRIGDIQHPVVREVLQRLGVHRGVEIHHDADLPARSGMGSSSAFTVGLLNAMHALAGHRRCGSTLAAEAIELEQDTLHETVGSQDQVAAAYGGFNHITFSPDDAVSVEPVDLDEQRLAELNDHLMLVFTGIRRTAADVAASYVPQIGTKVKLLRAMQGAVAEALSILHSGYDLAPFGRLLHDAWRLKRSLSSAVSSPDIEDIYTTATAAGALGGKIAGAGGGGFMLLFVPPSARERVRMALRQLIHVPFSFEPRGSQIILSEPESDYAAAELFRSNQRIEAFREYQPPSTLEG